ncbi:MAG: Bcr/CflA family efflux MFS transporter [Gemmobacter sp.]
MTRLPLPVRPLGQPEFIALIAMLFATIAFSIDAMLPALPAIAADLTPAAPNRAQLVLTSFVLGMGIGTFVAGPLSDSFGRRPVILGGAALYAAASLAAMLAGSLEALLVARVVQGVGAAGPRIVSIAIIRDLYAGREMARIMSFAMMIFTLFPAVAPLIGSGIIALTGWRGIFAAFMLFALVVSLWLALRQPETLPAAARAPLRATTLVAAAREVLAHPVVRLSILVQTLLFAALFGTLSSIQQVFDQTFGRAAAFPLWFALIAVIGGTASFLNARVVVRLGMRAMIRGTLNVQIALSVVMASVTLAGLWPEPLYFAAFMVWATSVFFMAGLTLGNINAIAMEPMGHVAGMAASVVSSVATVGAVFLAAPIGLAFDGTPGPLAAGVLFCALGARLLMLRLPG